MKGDVAGVEGLTIRDDFSRIATAAMAACPFASTEKAAELSVDH